MRQTRNLTQVLIRNYIEMLQLGELSMAKADLSAKRDLVQQDLESGRLKTDEAERLRKIYDRVGKAVPQLELGGRF